MVSKFALLFLVSAAALAELATVPGYCSQEDIAQRDVSIIPRARGPGHRKSTNWAGIRRESWISSPIMIANSATVTFNVPPIEILSETESSKVTFALVLGLVEVPAWSDSLRVLLVGIEVKVENGVKTMYPVYGTNLLNIQRFVASGNPVETGSGYPVETGSKIILEAYTNQFGSSVWVTSEHNPGWTAVNTWVSPEFVLLCTSGAQAMVLNSKDISGSYIPLTKFGTVDFESFGVSYMYGVVPLAFGLGTSELFDLQRRRGHILATSSSHAADDATSVKFQYATGPGE